MDATCNVQDSIHVFHLVHNMCPGFWVHIKGRRRLGNLVPASKVADAENDRPDFDWLFLGTGF